MDWAHLHLVLTHIPVVGVLFGFGLLVLALLRESRELKLISLSLFVLVALFTLLAYLTGEPAEEMVEHLPGVSESIIDRHEEAARLSLVAMGVLGVVSLGSLLSFRHRQGIPYRLTLIVLTLALLVGGSIAWTANLGGQIRHPEIRTRPVTGEYPGGSQLQRVERYEEEREKD
ncbi:MAG: hypothetical protein D6736_04590 [Nitrospinota bacterium]|nr:MAG: hypothetical protein D6736_04590 [Nitrospinota bacterium]